MKFRSTGSNLLTNWIQFNQSYWALITRYARVKQTSLNFVKPHFNTFQFQMTWFNAIDDIDKTLADLLHIASLVSTLVIFEYSESIRYYRLGCECSLIIILIAEYNIVKRASSLISHVHHENLITYQHLGLLMLTSICFVTHQERPKYRTHMRRTYVFQTGAWWCISSIGCMWSDRIMFKYVWWSYF